MAPHTHPNASPNKAHDVRRYPGVHPFVDDDIQRLLFSGRDQEKYELLQLVLAERLVLLFARSGMGKSSLINAGLLEPLRSKAYFPIVVRVSGAETPLQSLYEGVRAAVDRGWEQQGVEYEPSEASAWNQTSLWHFFKTFEIWRADKLLSPVLIIDQFEEIFTLYTAEARQPLIDELADLIRGIRPREHLTQSEPRLSDVAPEVKVVLALREDFYANLDELRNRLPAIYKTTLRLSPLSREQARRAIVEPAGVVGDVYLTPAFTWSDAVLDNILDFLSEQQLGEGVTQVGQEIEPFQLQLICQYVENRVKTHGLETITDAHLGGSDALKRVLSSFYEDSLEQLCTRFPGERRLRQQLEQLCEYGFITARGRRLLREESTIMQDDGVKPEILREMVELRLLRKEPRVGDNYYELTHDTLIEPIQLSRQARDERQARVQKKKGRLIAGGLCLVVIGVLCWSYIQIQNAEKEKKQFFFWSNTQVQIAEKEKKQALVEQWSASKAKAEAEKQAAEANLTNLKKKAQDLQMQVQKAAKQASSISQPDTTPMEIDQKEEAKRQLVQINQALAMIQGAAQQEQEKIQQADQERQIAVSQYQKLTGETRPTPSPSNLTESSPTVTKPLPDTASGSGQRHRDDVNREAPGLIAEPAIEKLSICEQYDFLNREPTGGDGQPIKLEDQVERLAALDARFENEAIIVTQDNLMVSAKRDETSAPPETFRRGDNVYINIWFSSPGETRVWLTYAAGNGERRKWRAPGTTSRESDRREIVLSENRLQGAHLGFRFFTYRRVYTLGTHTIEVFNDRNERLCQRSFEVIS